jgi:hypothetical protein
LNLTEFIRSFYNSTERNIQLDIFHDGEVLLQVYKTNDVLKWKSDVKVENGDVILELCFNKNKRRSNYDSFKNSDFLDSFKSVDLEGGDIFWKQINSESESLEFIIIELLSDVFKIKDEVDIYVRAY